MGERKLEQSVSIDTVLTAFVHQCHIAKRSDQESLCNVVATILTFSLKKMGPTLDGSLLKLLDGTAALLVHDVMPPEKVLSELKIAINNLYIP